MPRRRGRNSNARRSRRSYGRRNRLNTSPSTALSMHDNGIHRVHENSFIEFQIANPATVGYFSVSELVGSSIFPRLSAISKVFELCRIVGITIRILNSSPVYTAEWKFAALGYQSADAVLGMPNNTSDIAQLGDSVFTSGFETVPSIMRVSRRSLVGESTLKWYQCAATAGLSAVQGFVYYSTSPTPGGSQTYHIDCLMTMDVEFCQPATAGEESKEKQLESGRIVYKMPSRTCEVRKLPNEEKEVDSVFECDENMSEKKLVASVPQQQEKVAMTLATGQYVKVNKDLRKM